MALSQKDTYAKAMNSAYKNTSVYGVPAKSSTPKKKFNAGGYERARRAQFGLGKKTK